MYVDRHPLAPLIMVDGGKAYADHLPFLRTDRLVIGASLFSHVARPNATWRLAESGPEVLLVFSGAAAYVSPSRYPTRQETHEVVPTYNYVSVHVRGHLTCSHDPAVKRRCVERLTQRMEQGSTEESQAGFNSGLICNSLGSVMESRKTRRIPRGDWSGRWESNPR